ncbi:MAG: histone deacetylase [Pseudomonadota bacterium]
MPDTGVVLDPRYRNHDTPEGHPEHVRRLEPLFGLVEALETRLPLIRITPRPATMDEILLVHSPEYLRRVQGTQSREFASLNPDTPVCSASFETALLAVGGVLEALDSVCSGEMDRAMALVRPPGHHAERSRAMGYCIFNNVAVAAMAARKILGIPRVAIIDWDVHHGNGTQHLFEMDPTVLFISLHQFPHFPGSGLFTEAGLGPGEGFTVNIPLSKGYGDPEYAALFTRVVRPMVLEFNPGLILVSAGFDIHGSDPLGGMKVSASGFAAMARSVMTMAKDCSAPALFVLEGGYNPESIAKSVEAVLIELAGPPTVDPEAMALGANPKKINHVMNRCVPVHRAYWECWRRYAG